MHPLHEAVFQANYQSSAQRRLRVAAGLLLGLKHGTRGILFSWPLYALGVAVIMVPGAPRWLFALLLLPGLWVSVYILRLGVRDDWLAHVAGRLLMPKDLFALLWRRRQ